VTTDAQSIATTWAMFGFPDITDGTTTMPGDTLKIAYYDGRAVLNENGTLSEWETLQFHFHAPSEHTVDGTQYDAELHNVFISMDGTNQLLVLGIFLESDGSADGELFDSLQIDDLGDEVEDISLNLMSAVWDRSRDKSAYHYVGSLTTPPCSEGVRFFIQENTKTITPAQLTTINSWWSNLSGFAGGNGNNRNTQPMNARDLYYVSDISVMASYDSS
jgi:carbonic anhydrase